MNVKNVFLILMTLLALTSCKQKGDGFDKPLTTDLVTVDEHGPKPVIVFERDTFNFGKVKEGEKVNYAFAFKNEGEVDLIIGDAKGSCGCTVPKFPTHPIPPGESGKIDVEFNSAGKPGKQNKSVTVITNAVPSTRVLVILGEVIPAQ